MSSTKLTLAQEIEQLSEQLTTKTIKRDGEEEKTITVFADNACTELKDSVYKAHGQLLPSDWIFETYRRILEDLGNYEINTLDDVDEYRGEIVDGLVDVYTSDLTAWLNSSNYWVEYLGEAVTELGATDGFAILSGAQYRAIDEVYGEVINLLSQGDSQEEE